MLLYTTQKIIKIHAKIILSKIVYGNDKKGLYILKETSVYMMHIFFYKVRQLFLCVTH